MKNNEFNFNYLSEIKNVPVAASLIGDLKRLPKDWPIVSQVIETADINKMAFGLGRELTIREIATVMNLLNKYKMLWLDYDFINKLVVNISKEGL